jgi:hypothetical protein
MDQFYEDANSLFVQAYDAFYLAGAPIGGDVPFYERLARETGGGVLELACGKPHTGRHPQLKSEKAARRGRSAPCGLAAPRTALWAAHRAPLEHLPVVGQSSGTPSHASMLRHSYCLLA